MGDAPNPVRQLGGDTSEIPAPDDVANPRQVDNAPDAQAAEYAASIQEKKDYENELLKFHGEQDLSKAGLWAYLGSAYANLAGYRFAKAWKAGPEGESFMHRVGRSLGYAAIPGMSETFTGARKVTDWYKSQQEMSQLAQSVQRPSDILGAVSRVSNKYAGDSFHNIQASLSPMRRIMDRMNTLDSTKGDTVSRSETVKALMSGIGDSAAVYAMRNRMSENAQLASSRYDHLSPPSHAKLLLYDQAQDKLRIPQNDPERRNNTILLAQGLHEQEVFRELSQNHQRAARIDAMLRERGEPTAITRQKGRFDADGNPIVDPATGLPAETILHNNPVQMSMMLHMAANAPSRLDGLHDPAAEMDAVKRGSRMLDQTQKDIESGYDETSPAPVQRLKLPFLNDRYAPADVNAAARLEDFYATRFARKTIPPDTSLVGRLRSLTDPSGSVTSGASVTGTMAKAGAAADVSRRFQTSDTDNPLADEMKQRAALTDNIIDGHMKSATDTLGAAKVSTLSTLFDGIQSKVVDGKTRLPPSLESLAARVRDYQTTGDMPMLQHQLTGDIFKNVKAQLPKDHPMGKYLNTLEKLKDLYFEHGQDAATGLQHVRSFFGNLESKSTVGQSAGSSLLRDALKHGRDFTMGFKEGAFHAVGVTDKSLAQQDGFLQPKSKDNVLLPNAEMVDNRSTPLGDSAKARLVDHTIAAAPLIATPTDPDVSHVFSSRNLLSDTGRVPRRNPYEDVEDDDEAADMVPARLDPSRLISPSGAPTIALPGLGEAGRATLRKYVPPKAADPEPDIVAESLPSSTTTTSKDLSATKINLTADSSPSIRESSTSTSSIPLHHLIAGGIYHAGKAVADAFRSSALKFPDVPDVASSIVSPTTLPPVSPTSSKLPAAPSNADIRPATTAPPNVLPMEDTSPQADDRPSHLDYVSPPQEVVRSENLRPPEPEIMRAAQQHAQTLSQSAAPKWNDADEFQDDEFADAPSGAMGLFGFSRASTNPSGYTVINRTDRGALPQTYSLNRKTGAEAPIPKSLADVHNIQELVHIPIAERPQYLKKNASKINAVDLAALQNDPTFNPPKYEASLKAQGARYRPPSALSRAWDYIARAPAERAQASRSFKYMELPDHYKEGNAQLVTAAESIHPTRPKPLAEIERGGGGVLSRAVRSNAMNLDVDVDNWKSNRRRLEAISYRPQPDPDLGHSYLEGSTDTFNARTLRERSLDSTQHFLTGKTSDTSSVKKDDLRSRDPRLELQNTPDNQAHTDALKLKHTPLVSDLLDLRGDRFRDFIDNGRAGINRPSGEQQQASLASQALRSARVADKVSALRETVQHSLGLQAHEVDAHFKVIPSTDQLQHTHVMFNPDDPSGTRRGHTLLVNHALLLRRDNVDEMTAAKKFFKDRSPPLESALSEQQHRERITSNLDRKTLASMERERLHISTHLGDKTKAPIEHKFDAAELEKLNTGDVITRAEQYNKTVPKSEKLPMEHLTHLGSDASPAALSPADEVHAQRFKENVLHPLMMEAVKHHVDGLVQEAAHNKPEPRSLLNEPSNMHIQVSDAALNAIHRRVEGHVPVPTSVDNAGLHQRPELASADLTHTITPRSAVVGATSDPTSAPVRASQPTNTDLSSGANSTSNAVGLAAAGASSASAPVASSASVSRPPPNPPPAPAEAVASSTPAPSASSGAFNPPESATTDVATATSDATGGFNASAE